LPTAPCGVYQPRHPRLTPFFQVVEDYWEEYMHAYDEVYEKEYGPWRPHVEDVLKRNAESKVMPSRCITIASQRHSDVPLRLDNSA